MKKFVMRSVLLLALALLLELTLGVGAARASFTADSNITVTGVTLSNTTIDMLIMNGSTSDSWEFSGGTFTVSNPVNFMIGSADSSVKTIRTTRNGSEVACAVNTTPGTSYLTLPTVGGLYTITPSTTTTCTAASGAIAPGGSGTSSSAPPTYQSYNPATGVTSTEQPKTEAPKTEAPKTEAPKTEAPKPAKTSTPAQTASSSKVVTKVTVNPAEAKYISTLSELQKLSSWQIWKDTTTGKLYKIEAKTIKAANTIKAKLDALVKAVAKKTAPPVTLSRYLAYGSKGTDVSALQELLKKEGVYPEGIVNGSYGPATRRAVRLFQEKYNIAKKGQLGYGTVGTATRTKINALLAK